jgi:hypothetical protein
MSTSIEYSTLLVSLLKGILDREDSPDLWQSLMQYEGTVREYFSQIGLDLVMDDAEGLAYLRSQEQVEGEDNIPKLLSRRALSYPQSLLLALLRKKQIEHEASSSEVRLIFDKSLVQQMMEVFLGVGSNEVKFIDQVEALIKKAADMGFIRIFPKEPEKFEVKKTLRLFVDAVWLGELDQNLQAYREHGEIKYSQGKASQSKEKNDE